MTIFALGSTPIPETVRETPRTPYTDPVYWQNARITSPEQERITRTVEMVPDGVHSALDVGCGDGRISNGLRQLCAVVSVDLSEPALLNVGGLAVRASASRLPFPDGSFDLVCCTEVLEHLTDDDYAATLSELKRVTSHYVLLSVPADENLFDESAKCPGCGSLYHVWGHQRRFSRETMGQLQPDLRLVRARQCGKIRRRTALSRWIRRRLGGQWPVNKFAACPRCGRPSDEKLKKNLVTYACAAMDRMIALPPAPRWTICLYERD